MIDDIELLRRYVADRSDEAFAELVQRNLQLVYSAALRRLGGDSHAASDVSQQVFTALARHAPLLVKGVVLPAWLYATTRNFAINFIRAERRRRAREQEARTMQELDSNAAPIVEWERLRFILDDAMDDLGERDREAILMRFFVRRSYREIGTVTALTQDAARMRVERALDKLHGLLARRGVTSTAKALGLVLADQAVARIPADLAVTITHSALSAAAMGTGGGVGAASVFSLMNSTQVAPVVAVIAAFIAVGAAIYQTEEFRAASAIVSKATDAARTVSAEVTELTDRANAEEQQVAELINRAANSQSVVPVLWPAPAAVTTNVVVNPSYRSGTEFLATHPDARKYLTEMARNLYADNDGRLLRELDLPSDERERIIAEISKLVYLEVNAGGMVFQVGPETGPVPLNPRLRELLSEGRYRQLEELQRIEPAKALVKSVVGATYDIDPPLSGTQAKSLVQIVSDQSIEYQSGKKIDLAALNWGVIAQRAAGVLSEDQLSGLKAAVEQAISSRAASAPGARPN